MAAKRRSAKCSDCVRVGTKRSDLRCKAPDGSIWASSFEYDIYAALRDSGVRVRRAEEADSLSYSTPVKLGKCAGCGSDSVVQERTYTPDLVVVPAGSVADSGGYLIETKGYFPGPKRNLFRQICAQRRDVDLRLVVQHDLWVTRGKTKLSDWAKRYKIKFHVWDGDLPSDWKEESNEEE